MVRVRVKGGYEPPVVYGRVGEPLRIIFSREETASCSEHVVFPAFGKSAMLPPFEDVALELVPERAGEYEFTCQLGMLRGRLVVASDTPERPAVGDLGPTARPRFGRSLTGERSDTLLLALLAWVCSVPFLLLLAVPFLGWKAGGMLALAWLGLVVAACFAVCAWRGPLFTRSARGLHGIFSGIREGRSERSPT
jgi:hypothetical protein